MPSTPRIAVEAFEDLPDGGKRSLGEVDLTRVLGTLGARNPRRMEEIAARGKPVLVADLSSGLPQEVAAIGWRGALALPGLQEALAAFHGAVVGSVGYAGLVKALDAERQAAEELGHARRELARLEAAAWASPTDFEFLYSPEFRDDGYARAEDAVNEACCGRAWDEFAAGRTCPSWDAPEADRAAWDAELEKWVRARVRPWAFGTISVPWEGVDDQSIREAADDKRLDAWDLVEDSLSGHHEGAIDLVGNVAALQKAADAWRAAPRPPDAGDEPTRGPEADAALAAAVAEWNAAQRANVVSYEADMATAVPVFPDATRDEAIAWSRGQVAEAERRLGAARGFCTEEDAPVRAR